MRFSKLLFNFTNSRWSDSDPSQSHRRLVFEQTESPQKSVRNHHRFEVEAKRFELIFEQFFEKQIETPTSQETRLRHRRQHPPGEHSGFVGIQQSSEQRNLSLPRVRNGHRRIFGFVKDQQVSEMFVLW